jgi:malate dehydrogenase (oxaloacetate-decarboxylating)(NADP+)
LHLIKLRCKWFCAIKDALWLKQKSPEKKPWPFHLNQHQANGRWPQPSHDHAERSVAGLFPGCGVPCEEIAQNPELAYDYTNKGNLVAVISNGHGCFGLGQLGALGSKPVMEGKSVLFKRFADVNSIDIELDTEDPDEFCNAVKLMGPTFGGINLEDIKAPECFIIEQRLKEEMDIPVFHDDQHGTAVICAAGLINALHISGQEN